MNWFGRANQLGNPSAEALHQHPTWRGRGEGALVGSVGAREDQVPTSRRLPGTPVVTTRPCFVFMTFDSPGAPARPVWAVRTV